MSPAATTELELDGRVARLTLNRPDRRNALDPPMLAELLDALARVRREDGVSVLVLGARGEAFCAGTDVDTPFFFNHVDDTSVYAGTRLLGHQHRLIEELHRMPQLTLAAVNGDAVGGAGFGMAVACDLVVAVESARFWMIPGALDVIQDFGLTWLLQRRIGPSRTLRMATLGEAVAAPEAARLGFVDQVVDGAEALAEWLDDLLGRLSEVGVDALRMLKLMVRAGERTDLGSQLGIEAVANGLTFQSAEFRAKHGAYLARLGRQAG
ncbi:MAG: enoyl-CoA hydratase/isomerase family protein [Actinobacteria bacterium]|nr:enoyl-CoA hydratase/isomerase family protein [Actinomycetota bacterium]